MLQNVLDIDWSAHRVSIISRSGAILLFDFTAAFPSLDHDMIWDTLAEMGIPACFIDVIKTFYMNNKHILKLKGHRFSSIEVHAGVRQGCPLSGLLFALCVDVLIKRICGLIGPHGCIGAFADDIAMVVQDFWGSRSE